MPRRHDQHDSMRELELRVAQVPLVLGPRYDLARVVPVWDDGVRLNLSDLSDGTTAFLVCIRDASMEHYWEPRVDGEEWAAAQALFWGVLDGLYDGRRSRLCLHDALLDRATASQECGLSLAFAVPIPHENSSAQGPALPYWWCPKSKLRSGIPEFWGTVGYVLNPYAVTATRDALMHQDALAALDAVLHQCRLVYLDWGDGEEMLVVSRVITLADMLRACRRRSVQQPLRRLKAAASLRDTWQSLPPDIEPEYLADLEKLRESGLREIPVSV
jgi:hypothetical protein